MWIKNRSKHIGLNLLKDTSGFGNMSCTADNINMTSISGHAVRVFEILLLCTVDNCWLLC